MYTQEELIGMSDEQLESELYRKTDELEVAKKFNKGLTPAEKPSTIEIEEEIGQLIDEIDRRKKL